MTLVSPIDLPDTPALRKERGAFFTPEEITRFVANWAIRASSDLVFEPAAGDAAFLVTAVNRLRELAQNVSVEPVVHGVEIHADSARVARQRVGEAGGQARSTTVTFLRWNLNRSTTL